MLVTYDYDKNNKTLTILQYPRHVMAELLACAPEVMGDWNPMQKRNMNTNNEKEMLGKFDKDLCIVKEHIWKNMSIFPHCTKEKGKSKPLQFEP